MVQMLIEIANMLPPKHLQPQKAPPYPARSTCVITGQPAKYRCLPSLSPVTPSIFIQDLHACHYRAC